MLTAERVIENHHLEARVDSRELFFSHEGTHCNGTLLIPRNRPSPHPAAIIAHGGDAITRWSAKDLFMPMLNAGVAIFTWDKPGGYSAEGRWHLQSMRQRAEECISGMKFLQEETDTIDPTQIGFWGMSQAGWMLPHISALAPDTPFIIGISLPGEGVEDQVCYAVTNELVIEGFSEEEIQAAIAFESQRFKMLFTGVSYEDYIAFENGLADEAWIDVARTWSKSMWEFGRHNTGSDGFELPPDVKKLQSPCLLLFGDHDLSVDAEKASEYYNGEFTSMNHIDYEIRMFQSADHALCIDGHLSSDAMHVMNEWLLRHLRFA
jgi:hypothetical protein